MCTCKHGTEVGATGRQDHPVSRHFNAACYQLDVTQQFLTEQGQVTQKKTRSEVNTCAAGAWTQKHPSRQVLGDGCQQM